MCVGTPVVERPYSTTTSSRAPAPVMRPPLLSASTRKYTRQSGNCALVSDQAILKFFLEMAAPSLIFWPSLTGFEPGSLLKNQSSLSRRRLIPRRKVG